MTMKKLIPTAFFAVFAGVVTAGPVQANEVEKVVLWNKDTTMKVKASKKELKAGLVTFAVTNSAISTSQHEMIVCKLTPSQIADPKSLPYNEKTAKVYEDRIDDRGEVSELNPGESGSLTVKLKPGTYMLFCNVAGHYRLGMYTIIHVI